MADRRKHTVWLPVSVLRFDPRVNREINERHVEAIKDGFDPDAFGVIEVSERDDGTYVVLDGQHRVRAILDMGWADQQLECKVHRGLSVAKEANLFVKLNRTRNLLPIEKFLKRVTAGEPAAVAIEGIARQCGYLIDPNPKDGHLRAVVAAERIYRGDKFAADRCQPKALELTLRTIHTAWGASLAAVQGDVLLGIGWVILRYNGSIDADALASRLASMPAGPGRLLGNARGLREMKGGASVADCVASIVVDAYNKQRRTGKLADWWAA